MGKEKREIFNDRVESARDDQKAAKEEFEDALSQFQAVAKVEPSELQEEYDKLKDELEDARKSAEEVSERIEEIESIAEKLFEEWEEEMEQLSDDGIRKQSAENLARARERYEEMLTSMKDAEANMKSVLHTFDQTVLAIKHQLNAQAFDQLQVSVSAIESDVTALIVKMDASIERAEKLLEKSGGKG